MPIPALPLTPNLARRLSGSPLLFLLDVDGTMMRPVTPEGMPFENAAWAVSPDGTTVATSVGGNVELLPIAGGPSRPVPGASAKWTVIGWIHKGLLISEDPRNSGTVFVVDPATGRREIWADIEPRDPAGLMTLNLRTLVTTPDGRAYGYTWHRATSDLYIVQGWA